MKKTILGLLVLLSTSLLAMQSGLAEYRYTQGNYSYVVLDKNEFDALGTAHDKKVAFMDYTGVATKQIGFEEYNYTQKNYSKALSDDEYFSERMSRSIGQIGNVTGQSGYTEYKYTQGSGRLD